MLAPAPQAQVRHDYQRSVSTGSIALLSQSQCAQQQQPHLQYAHLPGASASYATMTRTETYTQPAAAKSIPPNALGTSPMQRKPSILGLGLGTSLGKSSGGGIGIGTGLPSALTIGRSATGGKASTASSVGGPAFVPHTNPNNDVPQSTNPIRLSAESANRKSEDGEHELDSTTTVRPFEGELHRLAREQRQQHALGGGGSGPGEEVGARESPHLGGKRTQPSDVFPGLSRRSSAAESAMGL
ncbi:hypothetical protein B0H13DRAFT_2374433 [Mycena leptocephala]|nr:hypothetical protein B0H13DRAFT_2374433 [Mycena leptocephala]